MLNTVSLTIRRRAARRPCVQVGEMSDILVSIDVNGGTGKRQPSIKLA